MVETPESFKSSIFFIVFSLCFNGIGDNYNKIAKEAQYLILLFLLLLLCMEMLNYQYITTVYKTDNLSSIVTVVTFVFFFLEYWLMPKINYCITCCNISNNKKLKQNINFPYLIVDNYILSKKWETLLKKYVYKIIVMIKQDKCFLYNSLSCYI